MLTTLRKDTVEGVVSGGAVVIPAVVVVRLRSRTIAPPKQRVGNGFVMGLRHKHKYCEEGERTREKKHAALRLILPLSPT